MPQEAMAKHVTEIKNNASSVYCPIALVLELVEVAGCTAKEARGFLIEAEGDLDAGDDTLYHFTCRHSASPSEKSTRSFFHQSQSVLYSSVVLQRAES
jgi:hypothetical protein